MQKKIIAARNVYDILHCMKVNSHTNKHNNNNTNKIMILILQESCTERSLPRLVYVNQSHWSMR